MDELKQRDVLNVLMDIYIIQQQKNVNQQLIEIVEKIQNIITVLSELHEVLHLRIISIRGIVYDH
jgi:hypothetical protein